jgi:ribosome production factor 1
MLVSHLGVPAMSSGIWKDGDRSVREDEEEDEDDEEGDGEKEEEEEEEEEEEKEELEGDEENPSSDSDDESNSPPPPPSQEEAEEEDLPELDTPGPTCFFKISNIVMPKKLSNHGKATSHIPELILNNFTTRLGHRCGRFLGSIFPHAPEFQGRQAVTFHNQRDYIFVRHHRYVFEKGKRKMDKDGATRARLQELGPRFSLRMRWMLAGGFDTKFGEYEYYGKTEYNTSRRKFHL